MTQQWLAAVLLFAEKRFRRVKGFASIGDVIKLMEAYGEREQGQTDLQQAA